MSLEEEVMPSPSAIALFDANCPMCVRLAQFAARRTEDTHFVSWQEFQISPVGQASLPEELREQPADRLRVWAYGVLLEGPAAWEFLLARNKDLKGLSWLASQIGLESQSTARGIERASGIVRRLCLRCPKF